MRLTILAALFVLSAAGESQIVAGENAASQDSLVLDNDIFVPDDLEQALFWLDVEATNEDLVRVPRSDNVYFAILVRPGLDAKYREESISGLARIRDTDGVTELLRGVEWADQQDDEKAKVVGELLPLLQKLPRADLVKDRDMLAQLSVHARRADTRSLAFVGLICADASVEAVWRAASQSPASVRDLLAAIPSVNNVDVRKAFYGRIRTLLDEATDEETRQAAMSAFVSIPDHDRETVDVLRRFIQNGISSNAAIVALRRVPLSKWRRDQSISLADAIVSHVRSLPSGQRTTREAKQAFQLANDLAAILPLENAQRVREALGDLAVRLISIGTKREEMRYDTTDIAVQAGRPVEIVFSNDDIMPHNLVVIQPGSMIELGTFVDNHQNDPDLAAAQYIPATDKVLAATRMLQPKETGRLSFVAPEMPGVYPFICTFPGHWSRMFGRMYVVEDVDGYSHDPASYLAQHPLSIQDEMLVDRPIVEEYSFAGLRPLLDRVGQERSFERAQKLFTVATCSACHRLGNQGGRVGPDLTDITQRLKPDVILEDIVSPSKRINEQFQTWLVVWNGKPVTGLKQKEDDENIYLLTNPLVSCEPTVIPKNEIDDGDEVVPMPTSTMPDGLLNRLTQEEILDLFTFILAGGDKTHGYFSESDPIER